jgi:hypothetical protein
MLASKLRAASATTLDLIEYVGGYTFAPLSGNSNNLTVTFGGNLTGGLDSSASEGDMVIAYWATGGIADRTLAINGYTNIADLYSDDTYDTNLVVAYKFMGATPDTTLQLLNGTVVGSENGGLVVHVFRGVDTSSPFDATSTTATGTNTVLCDPPAITPTTAGTVIVSGGAGGHIAGVHTFSSSDLTSFLSKGGQDDIDGTTGAGYYKWSSGTFNPAAFTFSGTDSTNYSWAAVTMALRPLPA